MDKKTLAAHKKAILKSLAKEQQNEREILLNELKKRKLVPSIGPKKEEKIPGIEVPPLTERPGDILEFYYFSSYDQVAEGESGRKEEKAVQSDGTESPHYVNTSKVDPERGLLSISLIQGQLFSNVYPALPSLPPTFPYRNLECVHLRKLIRLAQVYPHPVEAKVTSYLFLPSDKDNLLYADTGNIGMDYCGIRSYARNTISYKIEMAEGEETVFAHSAKKLVFDQLATFNGVVTDEYSRIVEVTNIVRLPANTEEFGCVFTWEINSFTSKNFTGSQPVDPDKYGLVIANFRDPGLASNLTIGQDPLSGRNMAADGGGSLLTGVIIRSLE